jgi:hypothetical protein
LAVVIVVGASGMNYNILAAIFGDGTGKIGDILGEIITFVVLVVLVAGIGIMTLHMMKTLNNEQRFHTNFSIEEFREMRKAAGKSENSSEAENQQCRDLLQQTFECWTVIDNEGGQETRLPKTMKEVSDAKKFLVQVIDIAPTDSEIVKDFLNYAAVVKEKTERQFDGSGMLLGLAALVVIAFLVMAIVTSFSAGASGIFAFIMMLMAIVIIWGVPSGLYFLACRTPFYMLEMRKDRKPSRFKLVNTIIAIIFGAGMAGITFRDNTTWYNVYADGRKEYDAGMNLTWMGVKLGIRAFFAFCVLFLLFCISLSIILWAFINYLRNYVIYK